MARFVPRVVQSLITQTPDATRVRDCLTQAVQPTLDFLNAYFVGAADGSLQILKNITAAANAVITGTLVVQGQTTHNAQTTVNGLTQLNGALNVTGAVNLGAALTVAGVTTLNNTLNANGAANIAGAATIAGATTLNSTLTVMSATTLNGMVTIQNDSNCSGTTTSNSLVSRQGIPEQLDCGVFWNSSGAAATQYQTYKNVMNGSTALGATAQGTTPFLWRAPRAGSIIGYSLICAGSSTGVNTVYYYKNGTQFAAITAGAGANNAALGGTHIKGVYPFAAGDVLQTRIANATAGNLQYSLFLSIEMAS